MEVQTVFDQMEAAVQQSSVDKQCLEIAKKELLLENDRLLQKIMTRDVFLTVMNSMSLNVESVNVEMQRSEPCDKCLNLDDEFSKTKQAIGNERRSGGTCGTIYWITPVRHEAADAESAPMPLQTNKDFLFYIQSQIEKGNAWDSS
ncbi:hypothetical protein Tco_0095754 [Tanacetum coccineum]